MPTRILDKQAIVAGYDQILAAGVLTATQRELICSGGRPDAVLVQQTSGSSGAAPLRIPRTQAEINWLSIKLLHYYEQHAGGLPPRVAFLGGISHMEADDKAVLDAPIVIRNFLGNEFEALDVFDPQALSMYPSFAREIVADTRLKLQSLRAIKLGGEKIFRSDLERIFARFPNIAVIEQLGSTEMPGIAFRLFTRQAESGYELSTDRFDFDFADTTEWQPIVVRDNHPDRAFPIKGWFRMDDEARVARGQLLEIRRTGDRAYPLWSDIDQLLHDGAVNVQLRLVEHELWCELPPGARWPEHVTIGGESCAVVRRRPLRLVDSNKMPLILDSTRVPERMLHQVDPA